MLGRDGHTVEENLALALLSPLGEDAGSTASECAGVTCPLMQCPGGQGHFFPDVSPAQSVCVTAGTLLCYRSRLLEDSSCMDGHTKWPPQREPRQGMTNGRCSCSGEPVWPQLKEAVTLGRMRTCTRAQSLPSKSVAHRQIEIPALPPTGCVIPGKWQTSVPWCPSVNVKSPGPLTAGRTQESAFEPVLFLQQGPREKRESC